MSDKKKHQDIRSQDVPSDPEGLINPPFPYTITADQSWERRHGETSTTDHHTDSCAEYEEIVTVTRIPHAATVKSVVPQKDRLQLDIDRKRLKIDNDWHPYSSDHATTLLEALINARGARLTRKQIFPGKDSERGIRVDKILQVLPPAIQDIIDSEPGYTGGYWIKPEYFNLT